MEIIRGKQSSYINTLAERLHGYEATHIDIGTGDGRFVQHIAQNHPNRFVIGIDACRDNLSDVSRRAPANTLFVIANALALPPELNGLGEHITINFPWGSLLGGLLSQDQALLEGLLRITCLNATLEVRLNGGALAEKGWTLEQGANQVQRVLADNGFAMRSARMMTANDLRACPTTWAKRLAFGRDPRAMSLQSIRKGAK